MDKESSYQRAIQIIMEAKDGLPVKANRVFLNAANFRNIQFPPDSDFRDSNLRDVSFVSSSLNRSKFPHACIAGCGFYEASLNNASFYRAIFVSNDFNYASMKGANLFSSFICNTSFRHADLTNARFDYASMIGVDFYRANLNGATFTNTDLTNVSFTQADLRNVDITRVKKLDPTSIEYARGIHHIPVWNETRGYPLFAVEYTNGKDGKSNWIFFAGCRRFEAKEAIEHWSSEDYPVRERGRAYCKAIKEFLYMIEKD